MHTLCTQCNDPIIRTSALLSGAPAGRPRRPRPRERRGGGRYAYGAREGRSEPDREVRCMRFTSFRLFMCPSAQALRSIRPRWRSMCVIDSLRLFAHLCTMLFIKCCVRQRCRQSCLRAGTTGLHRRPMSLPLILSSAVSPDPWHNPVVLDIGHCTRPLMEPWHWNHAK